MQKTKNKETKNYKKRYQICVSLVESVQIICSTNTAIVLLFIFGKKKNENKKQTKKQPFFSRGPALLTRPNMLFTMYW